MMNYDRRKTASSDVEAVVHGDGITLVTFVGVGIQPVDDMRRNLSEAIEKIRRVMNGGLLRDLESIAYTTLYGFDTRYSSRKKSLEVWTVISGKIPREKMEEAKELVGKYVKVTRG